MSNSVVEKILSSNGVAYGNGIGELNEFHHVRQFYLKHKHGYYVIKVEEKTEWGVDYEVLIIDTTDAHTYDACDNSISDIDIGYVVMSESSYRLPNGHAVTEFSQLLIEHSKGTLIITDSEDQSGVLVINSRQQ